jgi:hypothetical protein
LEWRFINEATRQIILHRLLSIFKTEQLSPAFCWPRNISLLGLQHLSAGFSTVGIGEPRRISIGTNRAYRIVKKRSIHDRNDF